MYTCVVHALFCEIRTWQHNIFANMGGFTVYFTGIIIYHREYITNRVATQE